MKWMTTRLSWTHRLIRASLYTVSGIFVVCLIDASSVDCRDHFLFLCHSLPSPSEIERSQCAPAPKNHDIQVAGNFQMHSGGPHVVSPDWMSGSSSAKIRVWYWDIFKIVGAFFLALLQKISWSLSNFVPFFGIILLARKHYAIALF